MHDANDSQGPEPGVNRRAFLGASAAITSFMVLPRPVLGASGAASPNEKLNIAGVGLGGQGTGDIRDCAKLGQNIVALCDVEEARFPELKRDFPKARLYTDYREMLEKEKGIDAVVVGTPDHNHAHVSTAAMRAGKHVYCEKPLTRTVYEARQVAKIARETKVATQMGNQGMAYDGNRLLNEWIGDGAIGPVREVHVWSDRPTHSGKLPLYWAQGIEKPKEEQPVPPTLKWDLWLGPAPFRPYNRAYAPFIWRGWWDYGTGGIGDMGIHNIAPIFSALKLTAPESLEGSSTPVYPDSVTAACVVHYQFPARGDMPPVKLHWYDGGMLPPRPEELAEDERQLDPEDGIIFVGDKGKILVTGWGGRNPMLIPASRNREYKRPSPTLPRNTLAGPGASEDLRHKMEWINACKTGSETRSDFAKFSGVLTEAVLLGSACIRAGGERVYWDAENLKFKNNAKANEFLQYQYRTGWTL
jgi:predicted dehydrogenase